MFQLKNGVMLVALCFAGAALADDLPEFNGGDVVVTASGVPQARGVAPVSVSVITAQDIANSTATTVQDVLVNAGGVHAISQGGGSAMIDLRGFGMSASSNTLLLVDGIPMNTNDQNAPSLAGIPLANVERIEIVRGSGAVAYGSGATGGVINVITKNRQDKATSVSLVQTFGSFRMHQTEGSFSLNGDRVSMDGFAQSKYSDHYMQNSAERSDSGGLGVNVKLDQGVARFYANSSSERNGIPGFLSASQFTAKSTQSTKPYDDGTVRSDTAGLSFNHAIGAGRLYFDWATRTKYSLANYPSSSYIDARKVADSHGNLRYAFPLSASKTLTLGVDWLDGTATDNNGFASPITYSSTTNYHRFGVYSEYQTDLWSGATATVGGRLQHVNDQTTGTPASGVVNSQLNAELHAWQLGLRQLLSQNLSVYAKQARSFRLPNADDVAYTVGGLLPQTSLDRELGVEWRKGESAAHLAIFRSEVSNEIQFVSSPFGFFHGGNVNLSPTRHQGIELEGKTLLAEQFVLRGNVTWQQAQYTTNYGGNALSGKSIPEVPNWLANLDATWLMSDASKFNVNANFVGRQRFNNDPTASFSGEVPAYLLWNTKLTHQFTKHVTGAVSVNNVLNRHYATYGSLSSFAPVSDNYYPGDPRTYQASLTLNF